MKEKKKSQTKKNRCSEPPEQCRCAQDPYKSRRIAFSSFWDDGADHEHSDDDIYGLICRMEQRQKDYRPLEPEAAQKVVERAKREMVKARESSRVLMEAPADIVAPFALEEIKMGHLLGSGGFSSVYEITSFVLSDEQTYTPEEEAARQFLAEHARRNKKNGETRYAIKYLRRRLLEKPRKYANGAIDLIMEKEILEKLEHPNIVRVRGVSVAGPEGFKNGRHDAYFIVVDKMKETLEDRVFQWRKKMKRLKRPVIGKLLDRKGKVRQQMLIERLTVAYHVASAMQYLHSKNIIYRDLKPSNVGFDIRGDCKIFDFGLCREMPPEEHAISGTFKMSGKVGTVRYMAPEVKNKDRYNQKADVYSYSLVLYEILMLARPREKSESEKDAVSHTFSTADDADDKGRFVCHCWPGPVQEFIQRAWSDDMNERPTMKEICDILREEITKLRDGDTSGLEPSTRRRSTHILTLKNGPDGRRSSNTVKTTTGTVVSNDGSEAPLTELTVNDGSGHLIAE